MKFKLTLFVMMFLPLTVHGGNVTVQACASAVVTSESSPGAIQWKSGVAGFNEECISLDLAAILEGSLESVNRSDSQTRAFQWGGCNFTQNDVAFTVQFNWNYAIQTSVEEGETASALVSFDYADEDYKQGSGTHSRVFENMIPAGVCVDGSGPELTARAQISATYSEWRLRNAQAVNGVFYDPSNPGHGFDFNVHEQGMTVFYYGHTADGERLWLISEPLQDKLEYYRPYSLQMFEVKDGTLGAPVPVETSWGTLTLDLEDCDTVYAVLDGADGRIQVNLNRITGLAGKRCSY